MTTGRPIPEWPDFEPGPQERKLWNRLHYAWFGVWPRKVVAERLSMSDAVAAEWRRDMAEWVREEQAR